KVRIRLRDDHYSSAPTANRQAEAFPHPRDVGCVALLVLGVHLRSTAEVVVASDHMEREERDVPEGPARVLAEARIPAVLALADQLHRLPAETDVALEEHLAHFCKPLERLGCARLRPMAGRPCVISRDLYERRFL